MSHPVYHVQEPVDWNVATRPITGETVSGDLHLVRIFNHGVLMAVVDGIGHGDEATAVAGVAVGILERHAQESVISLVKRCHEELKTTRGVVMTIASINTLENTVTWLGIGNVEGLLVRAVPSAPQPTERVLLRGGIVGYHLPALQASVIPVNPGDHLIFATDGIRDEFAEEINLSDKPGEIADRILSRHFKGNDDALVLVARYLGDQNE